MRKAASHLANGQEQDEQEVELKRCVHVPGSPENLMSISALDIAGKYTVFGEKQCVVVDGSDELKSVIKSKDVLLRAHLMRDRLYHLDCKVKDDKKGEHADTSSNDEELSEPETISEEEQE